MIFVILRHKLPPSMLEEPDQFIDESRFQRMADEVARKKGVHHIGYLICRQMRLSDLGGFGQRLIQSSYLYQALALFCRTVTAESFLSDFRLEDKGNSPMADIDLQQKDITLNSDIINNFPLQIRHFMRANLNSPQTLQGAASAANTSGRSLQRSLTGLPQARHRFGLAYTIHHLNEVENWNDRLYAPSQRRTWPGPESSISRVAKVPIADAHSQLHDTVGVTGTNRTYTGVGDRWYQRRRLRAPRPSDMLLMSGYVIIE